MATVIDAAALRGGFKIGAPSAARGQGFMSRTIEQSQTVDQQVYWHLTEESDGNLHMVIGAAGSDLDGATVVLREPRGFSRAFTLVDVGNDQVGAQLVISREQWLALGPMLLVDHVEYADGRVVTVDPGGAS